MTLQAARPEAAMARMAALIAGRLGARAIWYRDRCTWTGDEPAASGPPVHRSLGGDLYGGSAGIAWFLACQAGPDGDPQLSATAAAAARHALDRLPADDGLYSGRAGVALAAADIGRRLADTELVEAARILSRQIGRPGGPAIHGDDLIAGRAGTLLALLALGRWFDAPELTDRAVVLGRQLVQAASRSPQGWCWSSDQPGEPALCGVGHGAAGIAVALAELGAATGDAGFTRAALQALSYERSWFDRAAGNWPDLRELTRAALQQGSRPSFSPFWCHGAAGAGMARLAVHRLTGELSALAEAAAAVDTATATTLRSLGPGGGTTDTPGTNFSLCHGVASVTELHLSARAVTGDDAHLAHARRIAWAGLGRALEPADAPQSQAALEQAVDGLSCGIPQGCTPGLMLGEAGFGVALLRLAAPGALPSPLEPWTWLEDARPGQVIGR